MQRAHLVGGHQANAARRQQADAVDRAAKPDGFEEPRVVTSGGEQPGAAREVLARTIGVVALAPRTIGRALVGAVLARVHRRQSRAVRGRQEELGVRHAERRDDARPQVLIERHPRNFLDDAAEDVGVVAIHPLLTGLRHKRQRPQPLHRRADGLVFVGSVPAKSGGGSQSLRPVQAGDQGVGAVRHPGGVGEQVANRDRPSCRLGDHGVALLSGGHGGLGKGRNEVTRPSPKRQAPLFDQLHDRDAGQRLGLRRDAEDRVGSHAAAGFLVGPAERFLVHRLAVLQHQRHHAGNAVVVDVALQAAIDYGDAIGRQPTASR